MTVNCCIIHSERAGAARQGMRDSPAEDEARTDGGAARVKDDE